MDAQPSSMHKPANLLLPSLLCQQQSGQPVAWQSQQLPLIEIMNFKKSNTSLNFFLSSEYSFCQMLDSAAQESHTTCLTPDMHLIAEASPSPPPPHIDRYLTVLEVML